MDMTAAQRDLAAANVGGAPGVLVSGAAWATAGLVWQVRGPEAAFLALFVGGALIVPGAALIARGAFAAPKPQPDSPLIRLGFETTVVLFAGLAIAYALLRIAPAAAIPALAVIVGARYFAFRTLYAEPLYWALGGLIAAAGFVALTGVAPLPANTALLVGAIELGFAVLLLARRSGRSAALRA